MKIGRNDPCHCGSGQKYKKCHLPKDDAARSAELAAAAAASAAAAAKAAEEEAAAESDEPPAGGEARAPQGRPKDERAAKPKTQAPPPAPAFRRKSV